MNLLARHGDRCIACHKMRRLHAHHIVFRSLGGPTRLDNLATLCTKCHDLVVDPDLQVRDKRGLPLHPWRTCAVPAGRGKPHTLGFRS